jgi:ketosteroid isomerase-like protein
MSDIGTSDIGTSGNAATRPGGAAGPSGAVTPGGAVSPGSEFDQLVDRFFAAIERGDVDEIRRLYHPEARIWHNFDQAVQGVEENLATLAWMVGRLFDRRYEVLRRDPLVDGIVQQHVLRGVTRAGEPFALPACIFVRCRDGRVTGIEEYLDPAGAAPLAH